MSTAIQKAIAAGMKAMGPLNIAKLCTYTSQNNPQYDASTGTVLRPSLPIPNVRVVFYTYEQEEVDGELVRKTDQRALIAQADLSVTPTLQDTILDNNGVLWTVHAIETDPADAAWVLHVRK